MKRTLTRTLSCLLLAAMLLSISAFADSSTTTLQTVYKSLDPRTEIYAVTQTPGSDYPYYGALWEPQGGAYYGRVGRGGSINGGWGLVNAGALSSESAISFYYGLNDGYSLEYWSYLFGSMIEDGKRAFLVNLNFPNEGADCPAVAAGSYDGRLREMLTYMNTLSGPVFLRIGGEMNVWTASVTPESYIAAYQHVAQLARSLAPNVALVFSPNFSSAYQVDMDSFYPGDSWVDWIGVSLYYNKYAINGDTTNDAFYGVGTYGDAMLNIQQVINLSNLHKKPVIVTEGGSAAQCNGQDTAAFAAERVQKAYSFLTMVYPQVKCLIYSDTTFGTASTNYTLMDSPTVSAAYDRAVAANPTLLHSRQDTPSYYTALSALSSWSGTMTLAAYTYSADKLTASWSVDGVAKATASDYPYTFTLDTSALSAGSHTLTVTFSNGAAKSYTFQTGGGSGAASGSSGPVSAVCSGDPLYVDGVQQYPGVYKIGGNNYFKLRDLAYLLNGTAKQFEVSYDEATQSVTITSGLPYTRVGSEMVPIQVSVPRPAVPSRNTIYINGVRQDLTVYNVDGNNYFKLRDLAGILDFYVGYDNATQTVSVSTAQGYQG